MLRHVGLVSMRGRRVLTRHKAIRSCPTADLERAGVRVPRVGRLAFFVSQPAVAALWLLRVAPYLAPPAVITGETKTDAFRLTLGVYWAISLCRGGQGGRFSLLVHCQR